MGWWVGERGRGKKGRARVRPLFCSQVFKPHHIVRAGQGAALLGCAVGGGGGGGAVTGGGWGGMERERGGEQEGGGVEVEAGRAPLSRSGMCACAPGGPSRAPPRPAQASGPLLHTTQGYLAIRAGPPARVEWGVPTSGGGGDRPSTPPAPPWEQRARGIGRRPVPRALFCVAPTPHWPMPCTPKPSPCESSYLVRAPRCRASGRRARRAATGARGAGPVGRAGTACAGRARPGAMVTGPPARTARAGPAIDFYVCGGKGWWLLLACLR